MLPSCSAEGQEVTTEQEVSSAEAKEGEKTEAGGTKDPEEKAVLEDVDGPDGYVLFKYLDCIYSLLTYSILHAYSQHIHMQYAHIMTYHNLTHQYVL